MGQIERLAKLGERMTKEELDLRAQLLKNWQAGDEKAKTEYLAMSFNVSKAK